MVAIRYARRHEGACVSKKPRQLPRLMRATSALGIGINLAIFAVLAMALNSNYLVSNLVATFAPFTASLRGSGSWA